MRVVLTDGTEFSCENFKALESGVLLTKDKKRKKVIGFVPLHQLRYVVPEDLEPEESATVPGAAADLTVGPPASSAQPVGGADAVTEFETSEGGSDLRRLGGLGSTYAERLQAAGYETLADLAAADPVTVAEAASVAPGRSRRWVNAARRAVSEEGRPEADEEDESDDGEGSAGDDGEDGEDGDVGEEDGEDEDGEDDEAEE
jgi:predicted flap endonuclease-1-like 5' DNA nuclease